MKRGGGGYLSMGNFLCRTCNTVLVEYMGSVGFTIGLLQMSIRVCTLTKNL